MTKEVVCTDIKTNVRPEVLTAAAMKITVC
jgi:hypothetical protein